MRFDFGVRTVKAAPIFSDGFESGDISAWDGSYQDDTGILSVQNSIVNQGVYAGNASITNLGSWSDAVPYKHSDISVTTCYFRAYLYLDGFVAYAGSNCRGILSIDRYMTGRFGSVMLDSNHKFGLWAYNNSGNILVWSSTVCPLNTWFCLEVAVTIGPGNGECSVYYNGGLLTDIHLTNLTNTDWGSYCDTVEVGLDAVINSDITLFFDSCVVDTSYIGPISSVLGPPSISILSPENTTYFTANIPLTFTINETASWIGYSLDGQTNVTITGNKTILVGEGAHSIIMYANNTGGIMGSSGIVQFEARTGLSDVAVTLIRTSKTVIGQGYSMTINVTVQNKGDYAETSNLTLHANTTVISSETIALASHVSSIVQFTWNTTSFIHGEYNVSAFIKPVPGETNVTDNTLMGGKIIVTILGDVNGDGKVNVLDLIQTAIHWNHTNGDGHTLFTAEWYACINSDLNNDGKHDVLDLIICAIHLGQHW